MRIQPLILVLSAPLLAGCSSLQRPLVDGALGAAGGYAGSQLSGGNPAAAAGGAVGGVLLGEGIHALQRRGEQQSYDQGYEQGRGAAVKDLYWQLRDQQRTKQAKE